MGRLAVLLLLAANASAQVSPSSAPVVGAIHIHRLDIFDPRVPGESWWLFRVANKIHVTTRESVVRRELLLKPGDPWNPLKALESERNLRANGFFRKVEIIPIPTPGGKLDLNVNTQDSWTTLLQLSAGTEGGQNLFIYGIEEKNLLGYDKSVSFTHSQVGPLIHNDFNYSDPRFMDSRYRLQGLFSDSVAGQSMGVDVTRPFFSVESDHAMSGSWSKLLNERILYQNALEQTRFFSNVRTVQASGAIKLPGVDWAAQRPQAGWYSERDQFAPEYGYTNLPLPQAREMSGPSVGYTWIQPGYVKETYVNKMERVEDFNMGNELYLFGGFMGQALGSDRDRLIFNAMDQQGYRFAPGRFILGQIGASGRSTHHQLENTLFFANFNIFWKIQRPILQTFVAHAEFNGSKNLDAENQIILGGNNGLRGYESYSFVGNKAVLFNVEHRLFWPGEYFHLARLGAAAFFDSGSVVAANSGSAFSSFKSDVGLGLRVASTRSTGGNVLRIDTAYALNAGPGGSRWVFSVKGGQAFNIFNSSTNRVKQSPSSRLNESSTSEFKAFAE